MLELTKYGNIGTDERMKKVFDVIKEKITFITPEKWISKLHDHKGILNVEWEVEPTAELEARVNKIWEDDFNESETVHIFKYEKK